MEHAEEARLITAHEARIGDEPLDGLRRGLEQRPVPYPLMAQQKCP